MGAAADSAALDRKHRLVIFRRIGDLVGRKHSSLVTILVMGFATALVGVLPVYQTIGYWAPLNFVLLRMTQRLALGGAHGGGAIYVAEPAPWATRSLSELDPDHRDAGFFLSLAVIYLVLHSMSAESFGTWGWRLPIIISTLLLGVSVYVRLKLEELPVLAEMTAGGRTSTAPLTEGFCALGQRQVRTQGAFGSGSRAGGGLVHRPVFFALYFPRTTLKLDYANTGGLIAVALLIGTAFSSFSAASPIGLAVLSFLVGPRGVSRNQGQRHQSLGDPVRDLGDCGPIDHPKLLVAFGRGASINSNSFPLRLPSIPG